jgi:sortase B
MSDKVRILIIIAASLGIIVAAVMIITTYIEYGKADKEYSELAAYTGKDVKNDLEEPAPEPEEEVREFKNNPNRSDFPDMEVDYKALYSKNPDYTGWLYVPSAGISYPFVQGLDNEYYLHNTFENQANFAGCVFMDSENKPDLTDFNTFLYGHAMKNGSMFGNLRKLRKNPSLVKDDPYIYLFMKDGIYRYQIYSYYIHKKDSEMYNMPENIKEYRRYIRDAMDYSMAECEAKPDEEQPSVTLVTCAGSGSQKTRFFVHAIFRDRYLY